MVPSSRNIALGLGLMPVPWKSLLIKRAMEEPWIMSDASASSVACPAQGLPPQESSPAQDRVGDVGCDKEATEQDAPTEVGTKSKSSHRHARRKKQTKDSNRGNLQAGFAHWGAD